MKKEDLPNILPVFPLSNFIIFPRTTVPLNIFEPRYIEMVDQSMKSNRIIGMIQPKKTGELKKPDLHNIGCAGKITSFNETDDGRYLIILNGICRYKIIDENSYWVDTIFNTVKVNLGNLSNFIIPNRFIEPVIVEVKDEYEYKDLYEIKKETKLNQDFFNFIDHPYFSILIRVQEY